MLTSLTRPARAITSIRVPTTRSTLHAGRVAEQHLSLRNRTTTTNAIRAIFVNFPRDSTRPQRHVTKMIVVLGYGCDRFRENIRQRYHHLTRAKMDEIQKVEVLCNAKDPRNMQRDVFKTIVSWSREDPLTVTPFVDTTLPRRSTVY